MNRSLVISLIADDKPGIVEALSALVSQHQGNWLDSSLSQLEGKFAGIVHITLPETQLTPFKEGLGQLENRSGIQAISSEVQARITGEELRSIQFTLLGNDRPGIIKEISQAFSRHHINLEQLNSSCTSMPWSGTPMFNAHGRISAPQSMDFDTLYDQLDDIADQLGIDVELKEEPSTCDND